MIILRQKIYMLGPNGEVFTAVGKNGKATLGNAIKNEASAVQATQAAKTRADNRQANINLAKENPNALKDVATRARQQGFNTGLQQASKNNSAPSTPPSTPSTAPAQGTSTPSTTPARTFGDSIGGGGQAAASTTPAATPSTATNSNGLMGDIKNTWNSIPKWKKTAGIMAGALYLRNRRKRKEELEDREYRTRMKGR